MSAEPDPSVSCEDGIVQPPPETAALFLSAFDSSGDLVVLRGFGGKVVHVNKAFLKAFGGAREDWIGRWFSVAPPRGQMRRRYDMLMQTRSGPAWIEWDERVTPDGNAVLSIGRDVSQDREAHHDMEASHAAKALFFAAVTHELRTPLAGALGVSRLLEATPLRPDQSEYVRSVAASTEHALRLIDDILDLSRLEAGKLELRPEEADVAELVRETVELAATRAYDKGLEVCVVHAAGAPSRIEVDAARFKQILFNLIGNAVKFTESGGVRIDVENSPAADGTPRLTLSVTDTGPGISEADQKTLFEHFERGAAEREGRESGAGLGLAMVRRLVDAMNSSMGVESGIGDGSRFWVVFELPVLSVSEDQPLTGRKLGVACENAVLRLALGDQLRALGGDAVDIDQAASLAAASGRELLLGSEWADQAVDCGAAHIWQLVNPGDKDAVIEALPDGADGWLVKPVRRGTLIAQITGRADVEPDPDMPEEKNESEVRLDGLRILVAEDDPVNALIARKILEKFGACVTSVDNGPLAIQTLETSPFDAAILDQRMPGMGGRNVAELARLTGVSIPLIALTANASEADRAQCIDAGMDDFLTKPVDPDLLAETITRLCAEKKQANVGG